MPYLTPRPPGSPEKRCPPPLPLLLLLLLLELMLLVHSVSPERFAMMNEVVHVEHKIKVNPGVSPLKHCRFCDKPTILHRI